MFAPQFMDVYGNWRLVSSCSPSVAPGPQQIPEASGTAGAVASVACCDSWNHPVPGTIPYDVASSLPLVWLCKYVQGPAGQDVGTADMGGLNSLSGRTGTCHLKCLLFIQKDWADDRCRQSVEGSHGFDASKYLRTRTRLCLFGKDCQRDLWQEPLVEPSIVVPPVDWWIEMVINLTRNHIIYIYNWI